MGGSTFQCVTLKMFHGGRFNRVGDKVINCGKQCRTFKIDPNELCWWDLVDKAKDCGNYSHVESIHYMVPSMGFDNG